LAPQKPGFDLARELERKTEKLERETAYAIAENIRKRIKGNADALQDMGSGMDVNVDEDDDD
jgi:coiled-coil domain-containing protein 12